MNRLKSTRLANKEYMKKKLGWILHLRDNPDGPITAPALLQREADRLTALGTSGNVRMRMAVVRMAWAFSLASAWLSSREDQANLSRYRLVRSDDDEREAAIADVMEYIGQHYECHYEQFVRDGGDPRDHVYYDAAFVSTWGRVLDEAKPYIEQIDAGKRNK